MMPIGDGVLLVGLGERSNAKATSILAKNLFEAGAARLVIGARMPVSGPRCISTRSSRSATATWRRSTSPSSSRFSRSCSSLGRGWHHR